MPQDLEVVIAGHHQPPNAIPFDLADLVRVAVLLTDALGFDILLPPRAYSLAEIRSMLPSAAQYRFDPDPEVLVARLTDRLNTFD